MPKSLYFYYLFIYLDIVLFLYIFVINYIFIYYNKKIQSY